MVAVKSFLIKVKEFFITDFQKKYGDDSKQTRSAHSMLRWRKIFQTIIIIGAILFGVDYSRYKTALGAMGTPIGTQLKFQESKVPVTITKEYVDENYSGITVMFSLEQEALQRLPYEGKKYNVLLVSKQFKTSKSFPIVFSRYSTNGNMQLSIPLNGFKPNVPIEVYIVSKGTLQSMDSNAGTASSIDDNGSNADVLQSIQNATQNGSATGSTKTKYSGIDMINFTVVPNNRLQTTKINKPIFTYKGSTANFNANALNDVTTTSGYVSLQKERIKVWEADIVNQTEALNEGKARLLVNSQDSVGTQMVQKATTAITGDKKSIDTAKNNISSVEKVPSAPWVLSPLTTATTATNLK